MNKQTVIKYAASLAAVVLSCLPYAAHAEDEQTHAKLFINNTMIEDKYGIINDDTTLVPIRLISDAMGLTTTWDEAGNGVLIDFGTGKTCGIYIGGHYAYIDENGERRVSMLDTAPIITDMNGVDTTMIPIHFAAEEMDLNIIWERLGNAVFINSVEAHEKYLNDTISEIAPSAVMNNSAGDEQAVPYSEIENYRRNGWFIRRYWVGSSLDGLVNQLNGYISGKSGRWGIYIKNLSTGEYLVMNDGQYSSASIIKLFVMASVYNEMAQGNVIRTPEIDELLNIMITESDNYASNRFVKIIGGGNYARGFDIENTNTQSIGAINTQHKSLFIGYGDYVAYGRNLTSPYDCGIVLEKIYNRELVCEQYSDEMLSLLLRQQRRWKIPYLLPNNAIVANKTGETSTIENDTAIVYSPNCDYIICVLSNNAGDGVKGIQQISKMTYNYFNP